MKTEEGLHWPIAKACARRGATLISTSESSRCPVAHQALISTPGPTSRVPERQTGQDEVMSLLFIFDGGAALVQIGVCTFTRTQVLSTRSSITPDAKNSGSGLMEPRRPWGLRRSMFSQAIWNSSLPTSSRGHFTCLEAHLLAHVDMHASSYVYIASSRAYICMYFFLQAHTQELHCCVLFLEDEGRRSERVTWLSVKLAMTTAPRQASLIIAMCKGAAPYLPGRLHRRWHLGVPLYIEEQRLTFPGHLHRR